MRVIHARNVHAALPRGVDLINTIGVRRKNRNSDTLSDVLQIDGPVTTVYERPDERVLFWPERDCNPFFHVMEALWMLAGRNDVEWPCRFVSNFSQFSDDGKTFHGAYGFRWREHFGGDQIINVIRQLKDDPDTRRAYVGMWDPGHDCGNPGKDLPCNVGIHFMVNLDGKLDMTVFNRSNDAIWGAYGANAVHMSMLQEYVATNVGLPLGIYNQVSDNYHAYLKTFEPVRGLAEKVFIPGVMQPNSPYAAGEVESYPLISSDPRRWDDDLHMFLAEPTAVGFHDPFFRRVAVPMYAAYMAWKDNGDKKQAYGIAMEILQNVHASDWKRACEEWLQRRMAKWQRAHDDGVQHGE